MRQPFRDVIKSYSLDTVDIVGPKSVGIGLIGFDIDRAMRCILHCIELNVKIGLDLPRFGDNYLYIVNCTRLVGGVRDGQQAGITLST